METDLNKLRDRAYKNACEHGFHDEEKSDAHWLMLVITEIAEAVQADRKNKHADLKAFIQRNEDSIRRTGNKEYFNHIAFSQEIKDSVEDEISDIVIRLLDFAGVRKINIDISHDIHYSKEYFDSFSFIGASYNLVQIVMDNDIIEELMEEDTVNFSLSFVIQWCKYLNIDIFQHIELKMRYNELRPYKNGKKY